jgi:hypothetical protein
MQIRSRSFISDFFPYLELLGSTTSREKMRDDWLTVQQLLTAFHGNKINEK